MSVVLDKIFNGEYQHMVEDSNKKVVASGFKTWEEARRYIIRRK